MNTTKPLAVCYYRVSKGEQVDSVPTQRAKVPAHFAHKYQVVEEYADDGKSGSKQVEKRTDFLRMLRDLTAGKWKGKVFHILCLDKSRFGRLHTITGAEHKKALMELGVCLDTVLNGFTDWRISKDRIVDAVESESNHHTAILIAEKGLAGRIRVTREGRPNQLTPYGMAKRITFLTGDSIIIPRTQPFRTPKNAHSVFIPGDDREVEAVNFMFRKYADEDISYREIARQMNEKGFPLPGTAALWHPDTVKMMLKNPVYVGHLRIGETPKGEFYRTQQGKETEARLALKPTPIVVTNTHQGIIDAELWAKVQGKRQKRKGRRAPRNRGPYTFTGIVHCGQCGHNMYGCRDPKGRVMYRCHKYDVGASKCLAWVAYDHQLLPFMLKRFVCDMRKHLEQLAQRPADAKPDNDKQALEKQLARLDRKLSNARERFLDADEATAPGLMITLRQWEGERTQLVERLAAMNSNEPSSKLVQWWTRYEQELFNADGVDVGTLKIDQASGGTEVVVPVRMPAAVLRERLKQIDAKVFVWFKRKAKGRGYDLAKIRATATIAGQVIEWERAGCPAPGASVFVAEGKKVMEWQREAAPAHLGYADASNAAS